MEPPFPEQLKGLIGKDLCSWLVNTINDDSITQNLSANDLVLQLEDGKILWALVTAVDPSYQPSSKRQEGKGEITKNDTVPEIHTRVEKKTYYLKDFLEWCQKILLFEPNELFNSFTLSSTRAEDQITVLSRLLEISKRLHLFKAFETPPPQIVLLEIRLDGEELDLNGFHMSLHTDLPEIHDGYQNDCSYNDLVYKAYQTNCPGVVLRHGKKSQYYVEGLGFIHVEELEKDIYVRYRQKWTPINDFFASIILLIARNVKHESHPSALSINPKRFSKKYLRKSTKHTSLLEDPVSPRTAAKAHTMAPHKQTQAQTPSKPPVPAAVNAIPETLENSQIFKGQWFQMYGKKGPEKRFLKIVGNTLDSLFLLWSLSDTQQQTDKLNTLIGRQCVKLSDCIEIRKGQRTSGFGMCNCDDRIDDLSFSFIYRKPGQLTPSTIDLVCETPEEFAIWTKDLRKITVLVNKTAFSGKRNLIETKWRDVAVSLSAKINKSQLRKLFGALHIRVTQKEFNSLVVRYDPNHQRKWDFRAFERMLFDLETGTRHEITQVVRDWTQGKDSFTIFEFQQFLQKRQHESRGWDELRDIIKQYEEPLHKITVNRTPIKAVTGKSSFISKKSIAVFVEEEDEPGPKIPMTTLSVLAFLRYLKAEENLLFDFSSKSQYLDLSRPLNEYFIASSHNTYLIGAQYLDLSSVDAYVQAFRKGARCVEVDLHEGTPECPIIVTHGGAGTSELSFESVCRAIYEFAFENTKTPVILSLESHLHLESQAICADIFKKVFKDALLPAPADGGASIKRLPTPRELYGKILLKGKGIVGSISVFEDEEPLKAFITGSENLLVQKKRKISTQHFISKSLSKSVSKPLQRPSAKSIPSSSSKASKTSKASVTKESNPKLVSKSEIAKSLSEITYLKAFKVRGDNKSLEAAKEKLNPWNMSSFPDSTIDTFTSPDPTKFSSFNTRSMSRVYPNPVHVKSWVSGNFSPVRSWCCGVQCAALNYQTFDVPMQLNDAFFSQNGGCGYVPKPDYLCDPNEPFNFLNAANDRRTRPILLRFMIISGQNFEFPDNDHYKTMDPFIVIQIVGVDCDRMIRVTPTVHDNGFNPVWNEKIEFEIQCPELALLHIQVVDKDETIEDTPIGFYCIPVNSMKEGYRHFPLKRMVDGKEISPFCTLFCLVEVVKLRKS